MRRFPGLRRRAAIQLAVDEETVRLTALLDDEIASHLAAQETFDAEVARLTAALQEELAAHAATK
eukprot:1671957-Pyramimonas_sp.AAC.1